MLRRIVLLLAGLVVSADAADFPVAPAVQGAAWINSAPLGAPQLRGKVVLVEFWTFGCWNCRNVEPHVKQWHAKYADQGLLILINHLGKGADGGGFPGTPMAAQEHAANPGRDVGQFEGQF